MSLAAGTRLAHYEIVEPIGKGGMGEVYRARDTKLDRDVAIKVLPEEFAKDKERLARTTSVDWSRPFGITSVRARCVRRLLDFPFIASNLTAP